MDVMATEALSWLRVVFAALLGSLIGWLGGKLRRHNDDVQRLENKQDANNRAVVCLVRKSIIDFYDLYVRHSAPMTIERVHEITELYDAYKALGGDGVVDKMYEELMELPITVVNKQEIPSPFPSEETRNK